MKNEMTLTTGRTEVQNTSVNTAMLIRLAAMALGPVCRYYSDVLGQTVSMRQTLHLINAQLAFICTVFPATCPFVVRLLFFFWFLSALLKCRNSLKTCD